MQSQEPGYDPGKSSNSALGPKKPAERLLSFVGPRAVFAVIFAGILISAALILAAFSTGRGGLAIKSLTSRAGLVGSSDGRVIEPVNGKCPFGYRLDVITKKCISPLPPQPTPPATSRSLKLDVAISPAVVAPGGSYTLTATYVDAYGANQKYSGLLDVQLRLCEIANPSSCQSSTGPWGDYTLSNGSILINLPTTIGEGIYNASFIPRAQTGWTWSNEASVTVKAPVVTPPTGGQKIRPISASASKAYPGYPATNAIDENIATAWGAGDMPPQWIELDLGQYYTVSSMRFNIEKTPTGNATHQIYAGTCPTPTSLATTFTENLASKQWKDVSLSTGAVRYVRVLTTSSPSWSAWNEIETYGTLATFTGSCGGGTPPSPEGCLTGSVILSGNNIVVGNTTTASSSVSGVAVTYESNNQNVATVNGTTITAGNTAGSATISGRFVYAGRTCYLTSATLTVTGGNAQGTVSASPTDVYLCTSNGTSNQTTVTVAVTRGSGKVETSGAGVTFQGPTRLNAPNTWTQVISPGNFINLNATPNGQATVTITLKDYFTNQTIASKSITARINPPANCPGTPAPAAGNIAPGFTFFNCQPNASVTLTATMTQGEATIETKVVQGRYTGTRPTRVSAGSPVSWTVRASEFIPDPNIGAALSFELYSNGQKIGDSGVIYRDDRNCGTSNPAGNITLTTPSPASICPGPGVFSTVGGSVSVTNGGSNGSGSVTISGPQNFGPYSLVANPAVAGSYSAIIGGANALNIYTPGTYTITLTFNGQTLDTKSFTVGNNCTTTTPTYDFILTAIDTTVCAATNDTAIISFNGTANNIPSGYQLTGADEITVSKDGQIVFTKGFVLVQPGSYTAASSYTATVTGVYSVAMTFNGQLRGGTPRLVNVSQNCPAQQPTGTISTTTPSPASICPGVGVYSTVGVGVSVTNGGSNGSGSVTISGPQSFPSYSLVANPSVPGSYTVTVGGLGALQISTPGTYTVTLTFNGQTLDTKQFVVGSCSTPTPVGGISFGTPNPSATCPGNGVPAMVTVYGSVSNGGTGGSGSLSIPGLTTINLFATGVPGAYTIGNIGALQVSQPGTYTGTLVFNGQTLGTASFTVGNNCVAPTGSISVSGGTVPCNSTNGLVNISVSGQTGVQYSVARSGGWYYNTTGSGSTTDIVPLGTTYTYSLSAGSQYLGSKSVTGVSDANCGGAGNITADSPIVLGRLQSFPYSCIARQGAITATNSGNVNLTFSAGGVSYVVYPGQSKNTSMWYASAGTYTHRLTTESGNLVDSVSVIVTCI